MRFSVLLNLYFYLIYLQYLAFSMLGPWLDRANPHACANISFKISAVFCSIRKISNKNIILKDMIVLASTTKNPFIKMEDC